MRELRGLTLVDVPKQCRAKYADLVVQVIAEVESAEPAMLAGDPLPRELAWMKLSVVDAMVLNSTRSPGESQMVAVNRRIRNFHAEQWETLWLEATRTSGNRGDRASRSTYSCRAGEEGGCEGRSLGCRWPGQEGGAGGC